MAILLRSSLISTCDSSSLRHVSPSELIFGQYRAFPSTKVRINCIGSSLLGLTRNEYHALGLIGGASSGVIVKLAELDEVNSQTPRLPPLKLSSINALSDSQKPAITEPLDSAIVAAVAFSNVLKDRQLMREFSNMLT
jgi:hypothetical protein